MANWDQTLGVGDLVTFYTTGIWRITQIDHGTSSVMGPRFALERILSGTYKPCRYASTRPRTRNVWATHCKRADFTAIKDKLVKKHDKLIQAIDDFVATLP